MVLRSLARIRGACMVEAVLILPFAIMLGLGTVEVGRAMRLHMTVSRAAYEAARYGATFGGLHPNDFCTNGQIPNCSPSMLNLRDRVNSILLESRLPADTVYEMELRSNTALDSNVIDITLHSPFSMVSIVPGLNLLTISSRAVSPYLFPT